MSQEHDASFSSTAPTRVGSLDIDHLKDEKNKVTITDHAKVEELVVREPAKEDVAAWLRVLSAFLIFVMTWGPSTGIGAFESFYQNDLLREYSSSQIAWIGSIQTALLLSSGVVSGPLFDMGYLRIIMTVGLFMCVVAFMLLSLCTQFYQVLLTQGVLFGIGSGMAYVPAMAMVSVRFQKNRPVAMGIVASGSSVGGIIFPVMIRRLQPQIGFAWTVRTIGFVQFFITIIALAILLRDREAKSPPRKLVHFGAFKEAAFTSFAFVFFFQSLSYFIPFAFITSYAINHLNTSEDLGFYLLAVTNAASFFGRILPSLVSQYTGPFVVLFVSTVFCAVFEFAWIGCNTVGSFIAFCVLWGFFSGIMPSVTPVCVAMKPLSPSPDVTGTRLGMVWLLGGLGILIGNPIAGALIDTQTGSFMKTQAFAGAIMIGAVACYIWPWIARERYVRQEKKAREEGQKA